MTRIELLFAAVVVVSVGYFALWACFCPPAPPPSCTVDEDCEFGACSAEGLCFSECGEDFQCQVTAASLGPCAVDADCTGNGTGDQCAFGASLFDASTSLCVQAAANCAEGTVAVTAQGPDFDENIVFCGDPAVTCSNERCVGD